MRYTPYNSGAVLPEWLYEPRKRRRIAVTLGTVVPAMAGVGGLSTLVTEAGKVDADFVIALGDADPSGLGEVPDNVHLAGWIPLNSLAAVSDAAIHHGGAGTTMTVMTAGIPQIVLPHGADQFINAEQVVKAGIGMTVEPGELDAERIDTLLTDTGLRASAELVAGAIATQPTPAELVETIISVAR
jgi:UDP:flavonoid glycosyltransferase YjiC (YdhE family)